MKFFFVFVIVSLVCASAQSNDITTRDDDDSNEDIYFSTVFEHRLVEQYNRRKKAIIDAWTDCNALLSVPFDQAIEMFQNPPWGDNIDVSDKAKCLVDCTMNRTGAKTNGDFQKAEYMLHIKQLLMNHTSFNVRTKSPRAQRKIYDTIAERASTLTNYLVQGNQFFYKNLYQLPSWPFEPDSKNYDLIRSYARAADECKDLKDPGNNDCETSFIIMRCIMDRNRGSLFNSPFYPISIEAIDSDRLQ